MAAPTAPDDPSPVEVLTNVPRLSLYEASGVTLGARGSGSPGMLNDATSPDSAAQDPQFGGRCASSSARTVGGKAGMFNGLAEGMSMANGRLFGLNPLLSSASTIDTIDSRPVHPLDAYYGAGNSHNSDQSLPSIALHIPVRWNPPFSSESVLPASVRRQAGAVCVPEDLQDGLATLAKFAVRRNVTFAQDELFPDSFALGSKGNGSGNVRRVRGTMATEEEAQIPAGCVAPGGRILAQGVGARWYWNVIFEKVDDISSHNELTDQPSNNVHRRAALGFRLTCSAPSFAPSPTSATTAEANFGEGDEIDGRPFIITVRYTRQCDAFRALGHLLGVARDCLAPYSSEGAGAADCYEGLISVSLSASPSSPSAQHQDQQQRWYIRATSLVSERLHGFEATCNVETLGTMIDCSRNGVLTVDSVKFLVRKLALMGYNMLQLYTEDTYEIPDEPFFGYLRGGYTDAELREIDDYTFALGIEAIPCIQTLGHLGQMLQWPRFVNLRDTTEVLLAEWPETYVMLEKMIAAATSPFRTKKVHLGMDETHGLGRGRYHSIFGQRNYKDPTRIFVEHLQRVNAICKRMGLKPMIWSDMLFCLQARNNSLLGYYDANTTPDVQGIPEEIELVYWDYYHTSVDSYSSRIKSHRDLRPNQSPWMAAGSWTWSRFWTALPFTFATCRASQNAIKHPSSGVKHVFLTIWGDEGNEVDLYSSLPAWLYYADHAYTAKQEVDVPLLRAKFDGIVGGSFDDFVVASRLDDTHPEKQSIDDRIHFAPNTSKWLLWEEPFFGFISPSLALSGSDLALNYQELSSYLFARLSTIPTVLAIPSAQPLLPTSIVDYPFNSRLRFPYLLAKALALKAGLRAKLHEAYTSQNWSELNRLAGPAETSQLSQLKETIEKLWKYHRQLWMSMYKPFGWEIVELRYGGLRARIDSMSTRIRRFLEHLLAGGQVGISLQDQSAADTEQIMVNPSAAETDDYEEQVTSLPELAVKLHIVYSSPDQLLDYHRATRPTYC
ncbi:glycoside hydrolase family 20 protein [Tilletiaria anomala UBC 951]|uniref:beta-N-acetylhexosaminidase n=1 Tax=Tilletiaria anomala (strain ATCC 24038 / CBS 436.72 / UBC 951) TaxID=1037660 RepID=A0A066WGW2_TILAU|nr:glycoside hydrolase family 20 protein [Tilletiaria anomala UBC 951]KDN49945.1 glycoside hydrolase family 20 protein [Tilletiaria anomala UBC 951]